MNRYMCITIHPYFYPGKTALRYSENEVVDDLGDLRHFIFRRVLNEIYISGVEIRYIVDMSYLYA